MPSASFPRVPLWPVLGVMAFVTVIHGGWWVFGDQIVARGGFGDGDSYLRLLRIERLVETGDWFDISIPDANAPFGTTLHWTRIFDMVLLAASLPMIPVLGFSKALFWAGIIISPVIHILSAGVLVWALLPVLGLGGALFAGALSAGQAGILAFSMVGRADHHAMFILLSALTLGFVFRVLLSPASSTWPARWAGICLALGLWEGPEGLVLMALCLAVIGLAWLNGEKNGAEKNVSVAAGMFAGLVLFTFIERGANGFYSVEYDRLSIVHVAFAFLLMLFWVFVSKVMERRFTNASLPQRLAVAAFGVVSILIILIILFPKILGNPADDADPAIQPIYARISEYRAIGDLGQFLVYFGSILFAGPWILWRLKAVWFGPMRWVWVLIGAGVIVYLAFGLNWSRWSMYSAFFMTLVLGDFLRAVDQRISSEFQFLPRVAAKIMAIAFIVTGPMLLGALILDSRKTPEEKKAAKVEVCPVGELSRFLNKKPWPERSRIIVASANFGGELIYRTDHQVLATVHHRNVSGILDGHRILNLSDEEKIKKIIRRRQVDVLVLCPRSGDDDYFLMGDDKQKLYRRLVDREIPKWLRSVKLPSPLKRNFRLFEVIHPL